MTPGQAAWKGLQRHVGRVCPLTRNQTALQHFGEVALRPLAVGSLAPCLSPPQV